MQQHYRREPLVSIVTPVFNSERFIEKTIISIREQTYSNIEHIVVDGGSTDRTLEIVKCYPEIRLISERDEGMYDAINKGLRLARGSILAYLNSDDLYLPNTVEIAVESFNKWPDLEIIYGDCYFIDEYGKILYKEKAPQFDWALFLSLRGQIVSQPAIFWQKKIHEKYGFFNTDYKLCGDYDFFMRVFSGKLARHCGHTTAMFRIHSCALSQKTVYDMKVEGQKIWKKWELDRQLYKKDILWKNLKYRFSNWQIMLTWNYWQNLCVKIFVHFFLREN